MHGSKRICRYPCLIAAYHVLLRLLAPRHPSCALCSLINLILMGHRVETAASTGNMITETLVSDSALKKLYYYPVCRCQRTGRTHVGPRVGLYSGISSVTLNSKRSFIASGFFPLPTFTSHFHLPHPPHFHCSPPLALVGVAGFEPATLRLSSACSNQLSYTPLIGRLIVES